MNSNVDWNISYLNKKATGAAARLSIQATCSVQAVTTPKEFNYFQR